MFYSDKPPPLSTCIKAAWMIVDRFKAHGLHLSLEQDPKSGDWFAGFTDKETEDIIFARSSESAPHAICLASLKVVDTYPQLDYARNAI